MNLELDGKVVLVTGGSDGLGAALCQRLVAEGARVALCARNEARLLTAEQRLREAGGQTLAVTADVTRGSDVERFVKAAYDRFGRIDGLVNNAGTSAARPFESLTDEQLEADLQLKLFAAVRASRQVLPHLRASGGGAILNVLAISAKAPGARSIPTSLSRAAGMALTKALSKEVGPEQVRVNAVLIGNVQSGQWVRRASAGGMSVEQLYEQMARESGVPLGRVGRAEEFADLAAFLVSPRASYITGTAINFDGGLSAAV